MSLTRAQTKALIDCDREERNGGYPGIAIRKPTIKVLIKKGYLYPEDYETKMAVGTMYKLTEAGKKMIEALEKVRRLPTVEYDYMENWESYDYD